jgi:hypothetical protein
MNQTIYEAAGVWAFGQDNRPLAAICSIMALVVIGSCERRDLDECAMNQVGAVCFSRLYDDATPNRSADGFLRNTNVAAVQSFLVRERH